MKIATFKALLSDDGSMVAGMAAFEDGQARFFIRQQHEDPDRFVGRVSKWIKKLGGGNVQMQPPDVLPKGIRVADVIAEIKTAVGVEAEQGSAFDIPAAVTIPNVNTITSGIRQDN